MLSILVLALLAVIPQDGVTRETVDLFELNHFYDGSGRLVFDQQIFYDWSDKDARYNVRAWRLVKNQAQVPQRDWLDGCYSAMWHDGEQLRKVQAPAIRESWTQWDVELVEREYLPKERRKELRPAKNIRPVLTPP